MQLGRVTKRLKRAYAIFFSPMPETMYSTVLTSRVIDSFIYSITVPVLKDVYRQIYLTLFIVP